MSRETLREIRLRAIQLGEVLSLEDLLSALEDVDRVAKNYDGMIDDLNEKIRDLQRDARVADRRLNETISELRREVQRLNTPKPRPRRRSRKTPPDSPPKVIFPTYEIPKDAPNVVRVAFGAKDPVRAWKLYCEADRLDQVQHTLIEAERLYREAIRLDPSMAQARTNLGNILYQRGDRDAAIQQYQDALRIDPRQPEAAYNLGIIYHDEGSPSRAIALFELALSVCPPRDTILPDVHHRLAISRDEIGDVEGARRHWQQLIDLEPRGEWADYARRWIEETNRAPMPTTRKPALKVVRNNKEENR